MRDRPLFDSEHPDEDPLTEEEQKIVEAAMARYWMAQGIEVTELRPRSSR